MTAASLLVELQTEELPPKALPALSAAFAAGIEKGLRAQGLLAAESSATAFGSPRRLAVHLTRVAPRSADQPFRQKLVPVAVGLDAEGRTTPALAKKLKALGLDAVDPAALARDDDGRQQVLVYEGIKPGVALAAALQTALDETLARLPIPKLMSYQLADGRSTVQFARPAQRLVALHGSEVLPLAALGLTAGRGTFGHRFLSRGEIAIASADGYERQLHDEGKVIARFDARRARIVELVEAAARRLDAQPLMPAALLDEVCALVEWPAVYESGFEAEFLDVPPECLILTMQQNQKYFALQDAAGRLRNRFLLVSNIETDDPSAIVAGNARVVRARLADAKFFYDQDRKATLASRVPGLASVVYHNKLGSQRARVERLTGIATALARALGIDAAQVERAARLAKADLRTLMVGEFPELQGTMGGYYARHDGEPTAVAQAIDEHYRPRYAGDALPATAVGTCVALADKLETLVGLFGIGERPTGDKDPFALRRHALGVLRMLMTGNAKIGLDRLLALAAAPFEAAGGADDLARFFYDRLRGLLRDEGYSANEVEAVASLAPQRIDEVPARLAAVRAFAALPEAASLAAANKRIGNILKKGEAPGTAVDAALLLEPAERELAAAFDALRPAAERHYADGDYAGMLTALAPLKEPVDRFFDDVMVNVDDAPLRANRLALLAALRAQMNRVADLSLLAAG